MKRPIYVLLLETPLLLRGILESALRAQPDCRLLKGTRHTFEEQAQRMEAPDIVILGLTAAEDAALVPGLFARWPRAQILTVMLAGDEAAMYELQPGRRPLGQMSPSGIVEALKEAVQRRHAWSF